jgi:uncharacterized protein YecE (DUF72 family)
VIPSNILIGKPVWACDGDIHAGFGTLPSVVEVENSFFKIPSQLEAQLWADSAPENVTINAKAFRLFSGHPVSSPLLPRDIAAELSDHFSASKSLLYEDIPEEIRAELWRRFNEGIGRLRLAGKLGLVHFQFAPRVDCTSAWRAHIVECQEQLPGCMLVIEFRHLSWWAGEQREATLEFLRERNLAHVIR